MKPEVKLNWKCWMKMANENVEWMANENVEIYRIQSLSLEYLWQE